MSERVEFDKATNPYHVPAGQSSGGQFASSGLTNNSRRSGAAKPKGVGAVGNAHLGVAAGADGKHYIVDRSSGTHLSQGFADHQQAAHAVAMHGFGVLHHVSRFKDPKIKQKKDPKPKKGKKPKKEKVVYDNLSHGGAGGKGYRGGTGPTFAADLAHANALRSNRKGNEHPGMAKTDEREEFGKFNPYHAPAGDEHGGEFTFGDLGGSVLSPRRSEDPEGKGATTAAFDTDPTVPSMLPPELQAAMVAKIAEAFGESVTPEQIEKNIQAVFDRTPADVKAAGMQWYGDAHAWAAKIAAESGLKPTTAAGMIAAMSPMQDWDTNVAAARFFAHTLQANGVIPHLDLDQATYITKKVKGGPPIDIAVTARQKLQKEVTQQGGHFTDPSGKRLSDLDAPNAAAVIKYMGQHGIGTADGQPLRGIEGIDPTGRRKAPAIVSYGAGVGPIVNAVRIYRGNSMDTTAGNLNGHKVRSFYDNIVLGENYRSPFVTIDTHAVSAAVNHKYAAGDKPMKLGFSGSPANLANGVSGTYPIFAQAYRNVAGRNGIEPHQMQAIVWTQWRIENAGKRNTGKG